MDPLTGQAVLDAFEHEMAARGWFPFQGQPGWIKEALVTRIDNALLDAANRKQQPRRSLESTR